MGSLSYIRPASTRNLTVHISPAIPLTLPTSRFPANLTSSDNISLNMIDSGLKMLEIYL
jgi:hypothetical protein